MSIDARSDATARQGYDHFCPWSGTVVGKGNYLYFRALTTITPLALVVDLVALTLALSADDDAADVPLAVAAAAVAIVLITPVLMVGERSMRVPMREV